MDTVSPADDARQDPESAPGITPTSLASPERPTSGSTVTLLFTDIEGSTRLLQSLGWAYATVLADHHRLLRETFAAHGGTEIDSAGDGLYLAFPSARNAILATVEAQRKLAAHPWPHDVTVAVRMGLHTGEPVHVDAGYVGLDVHRAARLCAAGHGGQILVSQVTHDLIASDLPADIRLVDLGEHRLKDLAAPQRIYQVAATGLRDSFPALRTVDMRPNNLPRQLTSFVGREREIEEATRLIGSAPLLTLTGPGGVGKTRMALELAANLLDGFDDGAWAVELGSIADPDLIANTIASTFGVGEEPGRPLLSAVADHLRGRRLLLVLDDCEHVLAAAASAADTIMRADPGVRIIATSREPLGISGEVLFPVPSLNVPNADRGLTGDPIGQYDALRLFAERCAAAQPSFRVTEANVGSIAQLCRRLDGIPLALELAAARSRVLSVEQIAARLDDRFNLLTGGSRIAVPRHQTLRATIDWSYDLLTPPEKAVLRRLSTFAGGSSIEAAEAVCAGDPVDGSDVLDLLSRLVDRSLVVPEPSADETRFTMLETVREYARERLVESGEADDVRRRHRDWYLALAEAAEPAFFRGPEPGYWLERLDREHDNLRAALAWSEEEAGDAEAGLRLAAGLWRFWEIRGFLQEGRGWLERMLRLSTGRTSARRADALTGAGILAEMQGDHRAAMAFHEEAVTLQRATGDRRAISYSLSNLASAAVQGEDYERARQLYEEGRAMAQADEDAQGIGFSTGNLADVVARQGDLELAKTLFEESLAVFRDHNDTWGMAFTIGNFAVVAARAGDYENARALNEEAVGLWRGIGDQRGTARALGNLADVAAAEGDLGRARSLFVECLEIRQRLGDVPGMAGSLESLAWAMASDEPELAAQLVGAAEGVRESIRAPMPPKAREEHERAVRELAARLGPERFQAARSQGRGRGFDDVLAMLLP